MPEWVKGEEGERGKNQGCFNFGFSGGKFSQRISLRFMEGVVTIFCVGEHGVLSVHVLGNELIQSWL